MGENESKYRMLNRDVIKYIAMEAMLLNHIANIFLARGTLLSEIFLDIGYFTAITMCYFLVEGYRYTHSKKQYGIRLFVFALISQIPFELAFQFGGVVNMIFTLFICFLILVVREKVTNKALRIILQILLVLVTTCSDWSLFAPVFTIMFDAWWGDREKTWRAYWIAMVGFVILNLVNATYVYGQLPLAVLSALGSCLGILASGLVIQYLYNGKRAEHGRTFSKWFFYLFYPGHLLILAGIHWWMGA